MRVKTKSSQERTISSFFRETQESRRVKRERDYTIKISFVAPPPPLFNEQKHTFYSVNTNQYK